MGARSRTQRLLQQLREGMVLTDEQLSRLYAPVGIDLGADTPIQIALAIVTEIQAVLAHCSGGFLKDRQGAIHTSIQPRQHTVCVEGALVN